MPCPPVAASPERAREPGAVAAVPVLLLRRWVRQFPTESRVSSTARCRVARERVPAAAVASSSIRRSSLARERPNLVTRFRRRGSIALARGCHAWACSPRLRRMPRCLTLPSTRARWPVLPGARSRYAWSCAQTLRRGRPTPRPSRPDGLARRRPTMQAEARRARYSTVSQPARPSPRPPAPAEHLVSPRCETERSMRRLDRVAAELTTLDAGRDQRCARDAR